MTQITSMILGKTVKSKKLALHYCISTHLGGAEQSLLSLCEEMNKHSLDWSTHVLLPKSSGPLIAELEKRKIHFSVLEMPDSLLSITREKGGTFLNFVSLPISALNYLLKLKRTINAIQPDIIHTTGLKCHLIAGVLSQTLALPIVWHLRDLLNTGLVSRALRLLHKQKKILTIANSQATADSLQFPSSVVYNGFQVDDFLEKEDSFFLHRLLSLPREKKIIGVLGALAHWKGQKEFIKIADLLINKYQLDCDFAVIGDEIYDTAGDKNIKQNLIDFSEELGISQRVHFTGFIKENISALKSLHILVHTSIRPEPFGRVLVEAMLCGTPVVAARSGGPLEILTDQFDGFLSPPGDIEHYAVHISELYNNSETHSRVKDAAKETALQHFSITKYREGVEEVYSHALRPQ